MSGLKGSFSGHPKWDCGSKYNEGCQPTSNSSFELILALTSRAFRVAVDKTSDRRRVVGANVVRNESHVAVAVDADCFSNAQRQIETSKHDYLDFAFRTREKKNLHPKFFFRKKMRFHFNLIFFWDRDNGDNDQIWPTCSCQTFSSAFRQKKFFQSSWRYHQNFELKSNWVEFVKVGLSRTLKVQELTYLVKQKSNFDNEETVTNQIEVFVLRLCLLRLLK